MMMTTGVFQRQQIQDPAASLDALQCLRGAARQAALQLACWRFLRYAGRVREAARHAGLDAQGAALRSVALEQTMRTLESIHFALTGGMMTLSDSIDTSAPSEPPQSVWHWASARHIPEHEHAPLARAWDAAEFAAAQMLGKRILDAQARARHARAYQSELAQAIADAHVQILEDAVAAVRGVPVRSHGARGAVEACIAAASAMAA